MNSQRNYGLYTVAVAIAVIGALVLGVPVGTLLVQGIVLACPLMMIFMMRAGQRRCRTGPSTPLLQAIGIEKSYHPATGPRVTDNLTEMGECRREYRMTACVVISASISATGVTRHCVG